MKSEELIKQGYEHTRIKYEEAVQKFTKTGSETDWNKMMFNGLQMSTLQWVLDLEITAPGKSTFSS